MKEKVIISICGEETSAEGENDKIEFITEGNYYERSGKLYLCYKETEISGFDDDTTTTLKIDGDTVSMTRFGKVNTHMVFCRGKRHLSHYETPYGSFTIGILPEHVSVNLNDGAGDINIEYMIEIDNTPSSTHSLNLNVRKA